MFYNIMIKINEGDKCYIVVEKFNWRGRRVNIFKLECFLDNVFEFYERRYVFFLEVGESFKERVIVELGFED